MSETKPPHLSKPIPRIINAYSPSEGIHKIIINKGDSIDLTPQDAEGLPGVSSIGIWKTNESPSDDISSSVEYDPSKTPGDRLGGLVQSNGSRAMIVDVAPGATIPMHRTNTIDYVVLLSGQLNSLTPSSSPPSSSSPEITTTPMETGTILIQKGTSHSWYNPGPEWARFFAVLVDAKPVEGLDEGFGN